MKHEKCDPGTLHVWTEESYDSLVVPCDLFKNIKIELKIYRELKKKS